MINDTVVDVNDTITVTAVNGNPANVGVPIAIGDGGILTLNADGSYSFDPNGQYESLDDGENLPQTVNYTITTDDGSTATTTLVITVNGVNDAPTAVNDVEPVAFGEDAGVTAGSINLLANDSDVDIEPITAVAAATSSAAGADVVVNADGTYTYDASSFAGFQALAAGETTTDTFTYQVTDGDATSTATVTVTITGSNDAPTAVADAGATDEDTVLNVGPLVGIVSNDTDPDATDVLTVAQVGLTAGTMAPANVGVPIALGAGLLTVNVDGSYSFDPNGGYEALDTGDAPTETFSYQVSDGNGGLDTETVTITINGVNDAPVANDDVAAVAEGATAGGNVLTNDTDVDDVPTVSEINGGGTIDGATANALGSGATVVMATNGVFTYDTNGAFDSLAAGVTATDTFTYTITDDDSATSTATVTVTITGTNDAPTIASALEVSGGNAVFTMADVDTGDTLVFVNAVNGSTAVNNGSATTLVPTDNGSVETIILQVSDGTAPAVDVGTFVQGTAAGEVVVLDTDGTFPTVIFGNGGADDFQLNADIGIFNDGGSTTNFIFEIGDFVSGDDQIDFSALTGFAVAANGTTYVENLVAEASLAAIATAAGTAFGGGTAEYYFGVTGGDGYLFFDDANDGWHNVIKLTGVTNMDAADII